LSGGYEESGIRGRCRVGPGDVLRHAAFDSHLDRFNTRRTEILNLPIELMRAPQCWFGRVADPDALLRLAERDPASAGMQLEHEFVASSHGPTDWPDLLAAAMRNNPERSLEELAENMGLARETLSRGFGKVYGITPAGYRAEIRARRALDLIQQGETRLASVAAAAGFADQPHMTRGIRKLTGAAPSAWTRRKSNLFKTETT
jgi:AraC-like DNA-binding protein